MRIILCFGCSLLVLFSGGARADFVVLDVPGSLSTAATGISEGVVAGTYVTTSPTTGLLTTNGFLYQNGTYYGYNVPGSTSTDISRIYGRTIVGGYQDSSWGTHGFLLNGQTLTTLDFPGSKLTMVTGISGSTIAGWYVDAQGKLNGFVYNGKTFTTVSYPGAIGTTLTSMSGSSIFGYSEALHSAGGLSVPVLQPFLYQNGQFSSLSIPGLPSAQIANVNGGLIVGSYSPLPGLSTGFLFDGKTITTLIPPPGFPIGQLYPAAVDANGAVTGLYFGTKQESFLYTPASIASAPEPSSLTLLTLGTLGIAGYRWRSRYPRGAA